jgi:hypothetical protein
MVAMVIIPTWASLLADHPLVEKPYIFTISQAKKMQMFYYPIEHIYIYEYYYCYCINKYSNINVIVLIIPISLSSGTTFRSFQFLHCDLRRTSQSPRPRVVALVGPGRGSLPGFVVKPAVSSGFVSSKMGPKWEFPRCFEEVSKQFVKQKLKLELSKEYRRSFNPNHPSHR